MGDFEACSAVGDFEACSAVGDFEACSAVGDVEACSAAGGLAGVEAMLSVVSDEDERSNAGKKEDGDGRTVGRQGTFVLKKATSGGFRLPSTEANDGCMSSSQTAGLEWAGKHIILAACNAVKHHIRKEVG